MCEVTPRKRQAIILMHQESISNVRIAHRCGRESTVSRLIKRFKTEGTVDKKPRSGRPRLSSKLADASLTRLCRKNRFASSATLAREWSESTSVISSSRTVRRRVREAGFKAHVPRKKPVLSKGIRKKRLDWAKVPKNWSISKWRQVLFSDESRFSLMSDKPANFWLKAKESICLDCLVRTAKHLESQMVWGCMSYKSTGRLHFVQGTMKSGQYISVLKDRLLPSAHDMFPRQKWVFQQDLTPCNTSEKGQKTVKVEFAKHGINVLPWPGNAPDLNPIENLWSIIGRKISQNRPRTKRELQKTIIKIWHHEIPKEVLQNLADSMPKRVAAVIKARGGPTTY